MSRRKQRNPQPLREEDGAARRRRHGLVDREEPGSGECLQSGEETHVCDRCCAEFFSWSELSEHQAICTEDPLVVIVQDDGGRPLAEDNPPAGASPGPSTPSSDSSVAESTDAGFEAAETPTNDEDGSDNVEEPQEVMEQEKYAATCSLRAPEPVGFGSLPACYSLPSTNVTLEILHSTRVAVAQFSQGIVGGGGGVKAASAAIPVILEHLLALQQQQVHQLQLIEQICSQVATMNRHPTQAALNPTSLAPTPFPSQGAVPPPILPLSGTVPSTTNGQAAVSLSSALEKPQKTPVSGRPAFRDVTCTSAAPDNPAPAFPGSSTPLPPYTAPHTSGVAARPTPSPSGPLGHSGGLLGSSSGLPFLPQSPPSSVIFPNPLASIAATANALDPLAALMKHRKGKLPGVSLFETKPGPEEPFFKHKCRFCAKVFGSDSALQIHLRSHTGERPFKCNICGNRFSTKGNLKVHFQRHKEKYPHVQMNPYPVPEYLDNVPTSSGIPYGMSIPPEKPGSSWLDSKPVVAALPGSLGLSLSSAVASIGGSNDPVSETPSVKSPFQPAAGECVSLSPDHRSSEAHFSPVSEPPQSNRETEASNILKTEVHLPQNCTLRLRSNPAPEPTSTTVPSVATTPEPFASPASNSPPLSLNSEETKLPDSMQTSETSKLQQLVENIDKKITDPNQCILCHRVLSCQSALRMHYRIHTGERPFKCKVCGRAFTTKGNLKTHVGVHRENPPVRVQHSCPICQKKFTNAVVLQQHIRLHMVGQIPDSTLADSERNCDSLSSNDNDLVDDVSMEDENEEDNDEDDEMENMEEAASPFKPLSFVCESPPKSSAVVSSIAALENQMRMIDSTVNQSFGLNSLTNGFNDSSQVNTRCSLSESFSPNVSESSCSPRVSASPLQSSSDATAIKSQESQESLSVSVKREQAESPTSLSAQELRGVQPVKEEASYSTSLQLCRERGQSVLGLVTSTSSGPIKAEVNGHGPPGNPPFSVHVPGMTSLLGPVPARRTPKQHNCNVCGKNFSSASALQIHERTHTGEKPFVCSICGRAFTTKGNLKVHMGTHMWNNAPARRGRRLSVDNPMALLGGEAAKLGEMFHKDLAARAVGVDAGFWNRCATAITHSLAMKNNEISVIQNRGVVLDPRPMDRVGAAGSPVPGLAKAAMDLGNNRHFSMLIDDSKEIGIN